MSVEAAGPTDDPQKTPTGEGVDDHLHSNAHASSGLEALLGNEGTASAGATGPPAVVAKRSSGATDFANGSERPWPPRIPEGVKPRLPDGDGSPSYDPDLASIATSPSQLASDDDRVRRALFTMRESAAYLDVPVSTLHQWARPSDGPGLLTILPRAGRSATVPFVGFAEAYVLSLDPPSRCVGEVESGGLAW